MKTTLGMLLLTVCLGALSACSGDNAPIVPISNASFYTLDANATGVIEKQNNIVNMTVVSKDANALKAEYKAGFIQGKLQGKTIISARDNSWDNAYLTDPSHSFPKQQSPTLAEREKAGTLLISNYNSFISYLKNPATDSGVSYKLNVCCSECWGFTTVLLSNNRQPSIFQVPGCLRPAISADQSSF